MYSITYFCMAYSSLYLIHLCTSLLPLTLSLFYRSIPEIRELKSKAITPLVDIEHRVELTSEYSRNRLLCLPPLFSAVCRRHLPAVQALLKAGADVDFVDPYNGRTCLHICFEIGRADLTPHEHTPREKTLLECIASSLIAYAARLDIADSNGRTVRDVRRTLCHVQRKLVTECLASFQRLQRLLPLTSEGQRVTCPDDLQSNSATKKKQRKHSSKFLEVDKRW